MDAAVVSRLVLPRAVLAGWRRRDVDDRLAAIRASLERGDPLTDDLLVASFGDEWRGYAKKDVAWLLGRLGAPEGPELPRAQGARWLVGELWRCLALLGAATLVGVVLGAGALATLLVLWVVGGTAVASRGRFESFALRTWFDADARVRNYAASSLRKWCLVGVVVIVGALSGQGWSVIYLGRHLSAYGVVLTAEMAVALVVGVVIAVVLFRRSTDRSSRQLTRLVQAAGALLPRSAIERRWMVLVSVTAGVTEEVLFRGFGIAYVRWLAPGATDLTIVVLTSAAFGLVHLYQGARGVAQTGVLGAVFAWLTLATGTLVPAIVVHTLADLRFAFLPGAIVDEACAAATGVSWAYTTARPGD